MTSKRLSLAAALLILPAFLYLLLRGQPAGESASTEEATVTAGRAEVPAANATAAVPKFVAAPPPPRPTESRLVVDEIRLDKTEVCRGEPIVATVEARSLDGEDPHLRVSMPGSGARGNRIPFTLEKSTSAEEMPRIVVTGKGGDGIEARLPAVKVKDCDAPRRAMVLARLAGGGFEAFDFTVTVGGADLEEPAEGEAPQVPKGGARYEWDFGDGQTATTTVPRVRHDYGKRSRDGLFTHLLVTVKVKDAAGEVKGMRTVTLVNQPRG